MKRYLSLIQFYLDKKFLHNSLTKSFKTFKSQNCAEIFLENIKIYFKLDDIKVISKEELIKDEQLKLLFKDKLEELAGSFLSEAKQDMAALHEILYDKEESDKKGHRL